MALNKKCLTKLIVRHFNSIMKVQKEYLNPNIALQVVNLVFAGLVGEETSPVPSRSIVNEGFGESAPDLPKIAAPYELTLLS